jgi:hypothetical protein
MLNSQPMNRDAFASLRLPADLKREAQEIADKEHRTLSNTIELLLRRGALAYRRDGRLVLQISNRQLDTEEAARMAFIELVAEDVMQVIHERAEKAQTTSKKSKRA